MIIAPQKAWNVFTASLQLLTFMLSLKVFI